ncbi:MAG: hypothetical protein ACXVCN_16395 [Bdellovibrio sp.]
MTSEKQRKANQINAQLSTGPKSVEGKTLVSKNAIKHGLLASDIILETEDLASFEALQESLFLSLQPEGELERSLAERLISLTWRLRRATKVEGGIFNLKKYTLLSDAKTSGCGGLTQESLDKADLGQFFTDTSSAFVNLQRYESSLEKSYFKTLHELQRLQAARAGKEVPLPVAIDINTISEK